MPLDMEICRTLVGRIREQKPDLFKLLKRVAETGKCFAYDENNEKEIEKEIVKEIEIKSLIIVVCESLSLNSLNSIAGSLLELSPGQFDESDVKATINPKLVSVDTIPLKFNKYTDKFTSVIINHECVQGKNPLIDPKIGFPENQQIIDYDQVYISIGTFGKYLDSKAVKDLADYGFAFQINLGLNMCEKNFVIDLDILRELI